MIEMHVVVGSMYYVLISTFVVKNKKYLALSKGDFSCKIVIFIGKLRIVYMCAAVHIKIHDSRISLQICKFPRGRHKLHNDYFVTLLLKEANMIIIKKIKIENQT